MLFQSCMAYYLQWDAQEYWLLLMVIKVVSKQFYKFGPYSVIMTKWVNFWVNTFGELL